MAIQCVDEILKLIKDGIEKPNTNYREVIPPEAQLAIALR